jgi:DnaJ-class molecular chaperone
MLKFSDFKKEKCKDCGGHGRGDIEPFNNCPTCKGKGTRLTATETTKLKVPDGYEFCKMSKFGAMFSKFAIIIYRKLPHKKGDKKTFICDVCGGKGWGVAVFEDQNGIPRWSCPQCKGSPEIHATLTEITVDKDNNLIEKWSKL